MSTLSVNNLSTLSGDDVYVKSSFAGGFSFRNKIINGDMRIDQRNAGASVSTAGDGTYTVDRWQLTYSQSSKMTAQLNAGSVTPPPGYKNYLGITSSSAYTVGSSEQFVLRQYIEGFNIADLDWGTANAKTVTLSFWVRSSLTGTFGGALSGYSNFDSYPFTYTINSANTWEQKTIAINGATQGTWDSTNGGGVGVIFGLGVGSTLSGTANTWSSHPTRYWSSSGATSVVGTNGATFYITGVQLEVGSVATPFEQRPYGLELSLCQRYYETVSLTSGYWYSVRNESGVCRLVLPWQVVKRASPTVTLSFNVGSGAFSTLASALGASIYNADCGASTSCSFSRYTCSSEL